MTKGLAIRESSSCENMSSKLMGCQKTGHSVAQGCVPNIRLIRAPGIKSDRRVGLPNGLRKFTVVLAPVAMMVCGFDLGAAPTSSNGLVMTLVPTQKSFVAGELEYVRFVIENKGTNASEVDLGRCMVGNIPMWTESEPTKKLNRQLEEGGIHMFKPPFSLKPGEKYEDLLLLNEWFALSVGKHKLYGALRSGGLEISASVEVSVSKANDENLQAALKHIVLEAARDRGREIIYRKGLMEACKKPSGKKALLELQHEMKEPRCVEIIDYVLKYYDAVWGD